MNAGTRGSITARMTPLVIVINRGLRTWGIVPLSLSVIVLSLKKDKLVSSGSKNKGSIPVSGLLLPREKQT
jgi:hypothetical protein